MKKFNYRNENGTVHKRCTMGHHWVNINNFGKDKSRGDGLSNKCKDCSRIYDKERRPLYKEAYNKRYKEEHYQEYKNSQIRRYKERYNNDMSFRLEMSLRKRLYYATKSIGKSRKTGKIDNLIGCSIETLKQHIEALFDKYMSWDNYGTYWHIDHIKPCALFDFLDPQQQKQCFHYTNLQPLEKTANIKKGKQFIQLPAQR